MKYFILCLVVFMVGCKTIPPQEKAKKIKEQVLSNCAYIDQSVSSINQSADRLDKHSQDPFVKEEVKSIKSETKTIAGMTSSIRNKAIEIDQVISGIDDLEKQLDDEKAKAKKPTRLMLLSVNRISILMGIVGAVLVIKGMRFGKTLTIAGGVGFLSTLLILEYLDLIIKISLWLGFIVGCYALFQTDAFKLHIKKLVLSYHNLKNRYRVSGAGNDAFLENKIEINAIQKPSGTDKVVEKCLKEMHIE